VAASLVFTADTHVPKRARDLPRALWAAIDAADVVVHAGDWVDVALLDRFEERARRLVAVHGNNDHGPLRRRLPEVARAEVGGIRLAVVHETGDRKGTSPGTRWHRARARHPACGWSTPGRPPTGGGSRTAPSSPRWPTTACCAT
jgi:predicted phosphodiesterase